MVAIDFWNVFVEHFQRTNAAYIFYACTALSIGISVFRHFFGIKEGGVDLDGVSAYSWCELPRMKYLGHSGFVYQYKDVSVLINPWFHSAFDTWFPFPNNRFLRDADILGHHFDYLYISDLRPDHLDGTLLQRLAKDNVTVICPDFPSGALEDKLRDIGFMQFITLKHHEIRVLHGGIEASMYLDLDEHSGLLLDSDDHKTFYSNDASISREELPRNVDVMCAQVADTLRRHRRHRRRFGSVGLYKRLKDNIQKTKAKYFIPSGPPCFLPNTVHDKAMSQDWETFEKNMIQFEEEFRENVVILRTLPGDRVVVSRRDAKHKRDAEKVDSKTACIVAPTRDNRPEDALWMHATEARKRMYAMTRKDELIR